MLLYRTKTYLLCAAWVELNALLATLNAVPVMNFTHSAVNFLGFSLLFQLCLVWVWLTCRILKPFAKPHRISRLIPRGLVVFGLLFAGCGALVLILKPYLPGTISRYQSEVLFAVNLLAILPALWMALKTYFSLSDKPPQEALLYDRIRYHFLFNSLNTTACLISGQPKIAENNLVTLAHLFRKLMKQEPTVLLKDEIETAKKYIEVEHNRLGDRLKVKWSISDAEVLGTTIPSMVLQPLIENAVYHGIESCPGGGIIHIRIAADNHFLFFEIRNPIGNAPRSNCGTNSATQTIHARLRYSFGARHEFFFNKTDEEYLVHLKVPRKEA